MKLLPSAAVVLASNAASQQIINQFINQAYLNDFRRHRNLIANGNEKIFPISVNDASSDNPVTKNSLAAQFYYLIDSYVGQMSNVYGANFKYEAHYAGAPTEYSLPASGASTKEWNLITGNSAAHITWEGDYDACRDISKYDHNGNFLPNGNPNNVCTFNNAVEYCHRHGGELFLPDEFYLDFIFIPLCREEKTYANDIPGLRADAISTYSHQNYWLNMKRIENPLAANNYNYITSAAFHFFSRFNSNNVYKGWDVNNQPKDDAVQTSDVIDNYEYLLFRSPANSQQAIYVPVPFDQPQWHDYLSALDNNNQPARRTFTDMTQHAAAMNNNNNDDLNMAYIVDHMLADGGVSNNCRNILCQDTVADITDIQIQDVPCESQGQVRPICIIQDAFNQQVVCPNEILNTVTDKGHCGDNVQKFLVSTMFGRLNPLNNQNGLPVRIHGWNSDHDDFNQGEGLSNEQSNARGTNMDYNHIKLLRSLVQGLGDQNLAQSINIPALDMYVNCMGTWTESNTNPGKFAFIQQDATIRAVCSHPDHGFVYRQDNDFIDVVSDTTLASTTISNTRSTSCPCSCGLDMQLADINAANGGRAIADNVNNHVQKFCCAPGYEFVPNVGYENYHRVQTSATNTCTRECVEVHCRDEYPRSSAQRIPFWSRPQGALEGYATEANYRRIWHHNDNARSDHADQTRIQGTCQVIACPNPPGTPVGTTLVSGTKAEYFIGDSLTYSCSGGNTCGGITHTCVVNNFNNLNNNNINSCQSSGTWTSSGNCSPITCTPVSTVNAEQVFGTITIGQTYSVTCLSGFVAFRGGVATGSRVATTTCNGDGSIINNINNNFNNNFCSVPDVHDITCEPIFCTAPANNFGTILSGNLNQNQYAVGSTVTYACDGNTCGTRTATCTVTNNGFSASFTSPFGSCVPKYCNPPALNGLVQLVSQGTVVHGSSHVVRCPAGYEMIGADGSVIGSNSANIVCDTSALTGSCNDVNGACCSTTMQVDVSCRELPPDCPIPEDIPHGFRRYSTIAPNGVNFFNNNFANNLNNALVFNDNRRLQIGEWVGYDCDQNYDLVFTHNDQPARADQCWRQCYNPIELECGGVDADPNYSRINPIAVLDPLNCYCRPRPCPQITDAILGGQHSFVDPSVVNQVHWPTPGFNSVDVECAGGISENAGEANTETLTCNWNGWTSPGSCVSIGCPNPRNHAGDFYAPGLNLQHTCRAQDEILLDPTIVGGPGFINIDDSERTNGNVIIWAESETFNFFTARHHQAVFKTQNTDGTIATVTNGATARFFCKKGFKPYYNADVALNDGKFTSRDADNFACTCEDGIWNCNMHCRCEGYCVDEL